MSSIAAASHARGREARRPTEIPGPGWKEILLRVYKELANDRVLLVAAGATFYLLLAMVPALTALVSLYGLFSDPANVQQQMGFIQEYMPGGGQEILADQLGRLASQPNAGLGIALFVSLALALWSSNAGVKALFESMNIAYDEREKRSFIELTLVSLAFTLGGILMLLAMIGAVVVMPLAVSALGLGAFTELLVRIGSAIVLIVAALIGLSALYRWGPSRSEARWQWVTPGAVLTVVVAFIASLLFSWYVANFGSYNKTYGSLGAIIGFMTWLWIMVALVITGGEINAEMEHQTRRDTTTGPELPLGARGARMADTVASGPDDTGNRNAPGTTRDGDAARDTESPGRTASAAPRERPAGAGPAGPLSLLGAMVLLGAVVAVAATGAISQRGQPASRTRATAKPS